MPHEFRHLFTPLSVGGLALKNRILSTGHAEAMADDGKAGPRLPRPVYGMKPQIEFYEVFAITDNARSTVDLFEAPALR